MTFDKWLEEEYPSHSQYDFDSLGQYHSWVEGLRGAYKAGYKQADLDCRESFDKEYDT